MNFEDLLSLYQKYFSMGYIGKDCSDKLACISLTCYVTQELRKKGKNLNCYEVLCKILKTDDESKKSFLKALGVICEDLLYGCDTFPTFNIPSKEMPNTIKKLLEKHCPF